MEILSVIKNVFLAVGLDVGRINQRLASFSLNRALSERKMTELVSRLRSIVSDISGQESSEEDVFNEYWELKRRALQAFQCSLMQRALEYFNKRDLSVIDIGDSAGTHMLYLKELAGDRFNIETLSVNLDSRAIEKIKARGLNALLCRAEDLNLKGYRTDLFTSFEMVEHLHNPAIFFRRLSKQSECQRMVITVPYMKNSRVGLHNVRKGYQGLVYSENEHIFELSPADWKLLLLHSGWKVTYGETFYQYPRRIPVISQVLSFYWRKTDFEGFWGAIIEKETSFAEQYLDWED